MMSPPAVANPHGAGRDAGHCHAVAVRRAVSIAGHLRPQPLASNTSSAAVPAGFDLVPSDDDVEMAGHLRWIEQKDTLSQDMLLLGPPGALRRQLALRFCELHHREAEVLTVTRDTTEADLKQRRELSTGPAGAQTTYADGAPVRCARLGRILIIDGIEKAERNVLPTLNNLLENREMALDDGQFMVSARRFDALSGSKIADEDLARLVRVHENFRVIALALPCPPFLGNPLDPPLRSRFQARVIGTPIVSSPAQLTDELSSSTSEVLLRRLAALQRALNEYALGGSGMAEALSAALPPGARPPVLAHDALLRVLRLVSGAEVLPLDARPPIVDALARAYPLALLAVGTGGPGGSNALTEAAEQWVRHFNLDDASSSTSASGLSMTVRRDAQGKVLLSFGSGAESFPLVSPALPLPPPEDFVPLPALNSLTAALAQDFAVGHDCLLIGPPGCGKSALARQLAGLLGHGAPGSRGLEFFFLYEEMSSRDLLQRRTTDAAGRTSWVDSPLVRAARNGALCVLDGLHRLRGDVLCALAPLLQDRQVMLAAANDVQGAESELLLSSRRYKMVASGLVDNGTFDATARCRVTQIHPAFRVLALAEPPTARAPWLSDELSTYFSHHVYPELDNSHILDVIEALAPQLPRDLAQRLIAALAPAAQSSAATTVTDKGKPKQPANAAAASTVPLRVLIRVARRAALTSDISEMEAQVLSGILQQALFPFMPRGERAELVAKLSGTFDPKKVKAAAARALRNADAKTTPAAGPSPKSDADSATSATSVQVGRYLAPRGKPRRPELVPSVDFVDIGRHMELLEELARSMFERNEQHLLLLGPQGVGKNRVVDHLLQLLELEREYMQLHRDTTVAQLTVTPAVVDGRLIYEDSPLIRAAQHGRILVLDEADKAPLEVVVVLKSLVEDGQLALPDGRRLARFTEFDDGEGQIPIHPSFKMLVLANRPGFPFLGNDLIKEADVFSVFCLDNPDAASELQLVRAVAPRVPEAMLRTLVGIFADLRLAVEEGRLQYPYSTRELLAVVRHLNHFPDEPLETALASILAFDRFDPTVRETLRPIFEKRGVPISEALGAPLDSTPPELREPWLRALAALRSVRLSATAPLGPPVPAGRWRTAVAVDLVVNESNVEVRPAMFDPPQAAPLSALEFDRIQKGFSESVVRAQLPLARRSGPVVDAVAMTSEDPSESNSSGSAVLHLLSTAPMVIWTVEDPLAVGAQAGRCSFLPVGAGSDWSLGGFLGGFSDEKRDAPGMVNVNGRAITLGSPQLVAVPGAGAILLHSPLDILAPQFLIERPHCEDVHAEVLAVGALSIARRGQVRPRPEDAFVAVPSSNPPSVHEDIGEAIREYAVANSVLFFQPSSRRFVQLDTVSRRAREVTLDSILAEHGRSPGLLGRLVGGGSAAAGTVPGAFTISATATLRGLEVLLSWATPPDSVAGTKFLALLFPEGVSGRDARPPTARWVDAEAADAARMPLPALAGSGMLTNPFGSEAGVSFAAQAPAEGLVHVLDGMRAEDGSRAVSVLHEAPKAAPDESKRAERRLGEALPSLEELARADDSALDSLLMTPPPELPPPRENWSAKDAVMPALPIRLPTEDGGSDSGSGGSADLLVRVLEQPDAGDGHWLEAVHVPTGTVRRLPMLVAEETDSAENAPESTTAIPKSSEGGNSVSNVARVVPWPSAALGSSGTSAPDTCAVSREGFIKWLELHPDSLEQGLREYLEVRGLRGLMEEEEVDEEDVEIIEGEPGDAQSMGKGKGKGKGRRVRVRRKGGRGRPGQGEPGEPGEPGDPDADPGDGEPGAEGPEGIRDATLRQAKKQRRRLLEAKKREEKRREKAREASGKPKHGDEDDKEHVGGNRWAGGSGGADTAGLGGRGGPYRLEKRNQNVHQISDQAKREISDEAREAARKMGEEARQKRLAEIEMGGGDYDLYMTILSEVQSEIEQMRRVLGAAAARQRERVWNRGLEGELDENRLVDAIAGESAVFKRRAERESRPGEVLMQPKRICFLFDASASMYRFNGNDGRLRRSAEAVIMLMEALRGYEQKFDYEICCHDGDHVIQELVSFGHPPADEKERLRVVAKLLTAAQYCSSGDNTLAAIEKACERVETSGPADDYLVFAFSDANFRRYGITSNALGSVLGRHRSVTAVCFFIATFEDEALSIAREMPDRVKVCLDLKQLPAEIRQQFVSSVARSGRASL